MIVGPSRRRQHPSVPAPRGLLLHRQLARRHYWHRRLWWCSAGALSASLLSWALGGSLWVRSLAVLLGAASGFLPRLGNLPAWALRWIGERVGLSYQTALELPEDSDPHGFRQAVQERALDLSSQLQPWTPTAWWLPLLALAIGLVLLPSLSLPAFGGGRGAPELALPNGGDQALPNGEEASRSLESESRQPLQSGQELARATSDETPPDGSDSQGDAANAGGSGAAAPLSDEEALARFLQNLRERQPADDSETSRQIGSTRARPLDRPLGAASQRRPGEGRRAEAERGEQPPAGDDSREQAGGGANGESQGGEDQGQEGSSQGEGEGNGRNQAGDSPPPGEGQAPEIPEGSRLEPIDQQGNPSGASADGRGDPADTGPNEGAGELPSSERPSAGPQAPAGGKEDILEGVLGAGPENPGGAVRLPGSNPAALPGGQAAASYRRAVERAVTEGNLPVEYQEIVRNYFR